MEEILIDPNEMFIQAAIKATPSPAKGDKIIIDFRPDTGLIKAVEISRK